MANFLQALEPRVLFAGDVTAEVVKGSLRIRGDGADNAIVIELDAVTGGVVVRGDAGTTVNGSAEPLAVAGLNRHVRVSLGDGADTLTVNGANLPGRLLVRGGGGDDAVTLSGSGFAGRVWLRGGRGEDAIRTPSCTFGRGLIAQGGQGRDVMAVPVRKKFDFNGGRQRWVGGFADFDPENESSMNFRSGLRPLPAELMQDRQGFVLGGLNLSDDLFMFLKRRLGPRDGVVAGQAYEIRYVITFASDAPTGADGIGGSPGESVFLKAGASPIEPLALLDARGDVRLNVDKGAQSNSGPAASVIGGVGNGLPLGDDPTPYVSLTRTHLHTTVVAASAAGELWLLVGTDSGFEGGTKLYYQRIEVTLVPVNNPAA